MHRAVSKIKIFLLFPLILSGTSLLVACAIFGSQEDPPKKNPDVKYEIPQDPFEEISVAGADRVWQSRKTGNTIAYNSSCGEETGKESLSKLEDGILSGIDHVKVLHKDSTTIDGAPAVRTQAEGTTENIVVSLDLLTVKKGNCTYDLAYAAKKALFSKEHNQFNRFVEGFHAP